MSAGMLGVCAVLLLAAICLAEQTNYYSCFTKTARRSIDNYRPIAEFRSVSLQTCMQQCVQASGNYKDKNCESFTYNNALHDCFIYDTDGMKIPAIILPANGMDYYNRTSAEDQCAGPEIATDEDSSSNFLKLRAETEGKMPTSNDITHFRTLPKMEPQTVEVNALNRPRKANVNGKCETSMGYYVVIGNEVLLPTGGDPKSMKEFQDIDQGDCAKYCSEGQGPDGLLFECNSINYYPMTQKCQLFSILAEPHGVGTLVENQDVIYAEKFCLPNNRASCQKDEVFILHVEKRVTTAPIGEAVSKSITSCLQSCLNHKGCATAVFDSTRGRCLLHPEAIGTDESIMETTTGYVLIENGCFVTNEATFRAQGAKTYQGAVEAEDDSQWTEWSSCQFKMKGQMVRTRNRECKDCDGVEFEKC